MDPDLLGHLFRVAQAIGRAQMAAFEPERIGMMIAGLEVPHMHIHVVPIRGMGDLDFGNQDPDPDAAMMDRAAASIRAECGMISTSSPTGPSQRRLVVSCFLSQSAPQDMNARTAVAEL